MMKNGVNKIVKTSNIIQKMKKTQINMIKFSKMIITLKKLLREIKNRKKREEKCMKVLKR
jgi:hypothetical protein